ncbi:MAG: hypothetical protein KGZ86_01945 [Candidatus Latescibacteria bacterium]|nr:hypothetical protein [Candidatus Latescibacterota bacterium]
MKTYNRDNPLIYIKFSILPILFAAYPVIFHYGNNLGVAAISSAAQILFWFLLLSILVYALVLFIGKFQPAQAANASIIFLWFILFYGLVFESLKKWDIVAIEHYSLIPFVIFVLLHGSRIIYRMNTASSMQLWKISMFVVCSLIIMNLVPVTVANIRLQISETQKGSFIPENPATFSSASYPDIYYIVFDEMAGFEVIRRYWEHDSVNEFVEYLTANGFFVAENSHANAPSTMNEMARRLNYEIFPYTPDSRGEQYLLEQQAIINNKSMQYLKMLGYTTIVYSELNSDFLFAAMPPINADIVYKQPENYKATDSKMVLDDFIVLVLRNTLAIPWLEQVDIANPSLEQHKQMIFFTIESVPALDIPSPKFIYVHLAVPHTPFLFDQYGRLLEPRDYYNWDKYLGQHIYSLRLAKTLLDGILNSADPANPPVIIFQSDHGARNLEGTNYLQNYPDEYKTWIVNAFLLPGCGDAPLTQDMNPINTFPIVFNCYFDARIPLK